MNVMNIILENNKRRWKIKDKGVKDNCAREGGARGDKKVWINDGNHRREKNELRLAINGRLNWLTNWLNPWIIL